MDESQLIKSAQSGDLNDFRLLMEHHAHLIWRVINALVADPILVAEGVQETWVEVWKQLPDFSGDDPFRVWLLKVIAATTKTRIRPQPLTFLEPYVMYRWNQKDRAAPHAAKSRVDAILQRLPTQQHRFLKLHFYAGLDLAEIALVLHTPLKEVKAQRQGALRSLHALLLADHAMKRLLKSHMELKDE